MLSGSTRSLSFCVDMDCCLCSNMLEELMDDEDEMRDMNLSSRPSREEKRRVRERDRLEREMERCDHLLHARV